MKLIPLLCLIALLFVTGCASTPTPLPDLHNQVLKADSDWKEFNAEKIPKLFDSALVARERRIYEKVRRSDVPDWRKRKAAWNYFKAVHSARVPSIPTPPGRGTPQPNPFL